MVWGAVIGGLITAAGGAASAHAASKASGKGADRAADVQQYMYDTTRSDMAPYRRVGESALGKLARLYGLEAPGSSFDVSAFPASGPVNEHTVVRAYRESMGRDPTEAELRYYTDRERGDQLYMDVVRPGMERRPQQQAGAPDYSEFYDSPDYRFAFDEGNRAISQSLAARGLAGSGRALKELTRYGQGMASQQLSNYTNRLSSLAGTGQTATTNLGTFGANAASQIGGARQDAADARASGYLGVGNAINRGVEQGYGMWQLERMRRNG